MSESGWSRGRRTGSKGVPLGSGYVLHERLGEGATGVVWRGERVRRDGAVAIKTLRADLAGDPESVARFLVERQALVEVDHPNVVRVHDLVAESGQLAIVMDLAAGQDLRAHLRSSNPTVEDAAEVTRQVLLGLESIHAAGIVHRDVKPENVIVTAGSPLHVSLTDFGLARVTHAPNVTRHAGMIGTPTYLAPELAEDVEPTPAVDLYSVGIMFYELLAGAPPFVANHPVALVGKHQKDEPAMVEAIPEAFVPVLQKLLAKSPAERFASAHEARLALEAAAASLPAEQVGRASSFGGQVETDGTMTRLATVSAAVPIKPSEDRRKRFVLLAGIVAAVVLLAGAALALRGGGSEPSGGVTIAGGERDGDAEAATSSAEPTTAPSSTSAVASSSATEGVPTTEAAPTTVVEELAASDTSTTTTEAPTTTTAAPTTQAPATTSAPTAQATTTTQAAATTTTSPPTTTTASTTMPAMFGWAPSEVEAFATSAGVTVVTSFDDDANTASPCGRVSGQSPSTGSSLVVGDLIRVWLANHSECREPTSGTVPAVITLDVSTAQSTLAAAGYDAVVVRRDDAFEGATCGVVFVQSPPSGTELPAGSSVTIGIPDRPDCP